MKKKEVKEIKLSERIKYLIEELPRKRAEIKRRIQKAQKKQKEYYNRKIKLKKKFNIKDKILSLNV